jgi:hypothetical protein
MTRRAGLALTAAAALSACMPFGRGGGTASDLPEGTRIVLVRHMDRDGGNLNLMGIRRAEALVEAISDVPLDAIYTHDLERNLDSTRPLSRTRRIEMTLIDPDAVPDTLPGLAAGRSVIWVGNTGNLGRIWEALSLPGEAPVTYGRIAIVEAGPGGRLHVEHRTFGPPPAVE